MRGKDLLDAMNELEDGILEETRKGRNHHRKVSKRLATSVAVCFLTVAAIWAVSVLPRWEQGNQVSLDTGEQSTKGNTDDKFVVDTQKRITGNYGAWPAKWAYSAGVVDLDTIRAWHAIYLDMDKKEDELPRIQEEYLRNTYFEYMETRKTDVLDTTEYIMENMMQQEYIVTDEKGEVAFTCYCYDGSSSSMAFEPTLKSCWSNDYFSLGTGSQYDLDVFLSEQKKKKNMMQNDAEYVMQVLEADQYGGLGYDFEEDALCIWLADESYRTKLEKKGIVCKEATLTLEEQYQIMYEVWKRREELELMDVFWSYGSDKISVYCWVEENEFWDILGDYKDVIEYEQAQTSLSDGFDYTKLGFLNARINDIENLDVFIEFLKEHDKTWSMYEGERTEYYKKMRTALMKLKEEYPEYSYIQLYYHVAADCNYEWYLDFEEDLELFVESLAGYQEELDFLREMEFGDPERLEIKGLLRLYKELEPEKSYEELYNEHDVLKDLERNQYLTSEEKLFIRLCEKYQGKEQLVLFREREKSARRAEILEKTLIVAGIVLVVAVTALLIYGLRRKYKDWQYPQQVAVEPIPVQGLEKRRIAVLLVALCLALQPQGTYCCQPEGLDYEISIPYYLFRTAGEIHLEDHIIDTAQIEVEHLVYMDVIAYLYVFVAVALIIESICQLRIKKDITSLLEKTMKLFRGLAIAQLAGSLLHVKQYIIMEDWYWMIGICIIQLFIAVGVYIGTFGYVRYTPRSSTLETVRQIVYIGVSLLSIGGICFQGYPMTERDDDNMFWAMGNMFLISPMGAMNEISVFWWIVIISGLFVWLGIVLIYGPEKLRIGFLRIAKRLVKWIVAVYLGWMCISSLIILPILSEGCYFMPGILHLIMMSWSCWRLSGAGEREI